jgi:molecular chaperone DnaJ
MPRDYYEVLGVSREAGDDEIKKAFRALARELHPDVNRHDPAAEEKFKEAAGAYEALSDRERRAVYDRYGHEGLRTGGFEPRFANFSNISDIFEAFFGRDDSFASMFGGGAGRPGRGRDVAMEVDITLAEVASGTRTDVEYESLGPCPNCNGNGAEPGTPIVTCKSCQGAGQIRSVARTVFGDMIRNEVCSRCRGEGKIPSQPCQTCGGAGRERQAERLSVEIPAGIEDGQRVRITGRGHAGERGSASGDLYVIVNVEPDPRFERHGGDLVTKLDAPFTDAALGATLVVPTVEGEEQVTLDPGTQPGTVVRLRERGLPSLGGRRRGDLHVVVNVMVPRNLSEEQRELLRQFADRANGANYPHEDERVGIFDRIRHAFRG